MNRSGTAWKIVVAVLALLLTLFLVAEVGLRTFISNQVTSETAAEGTEVFFGSSPLTLGLLGGKLPHMTLDQPSTLVVNGNEILGQPATRVEMNDVRFNGGEPVADDLNVVTELPNEAIRAMLNQQLEQQIGDSFLANLITVSDVTTDEAAGTFSIFFTGGAAGIELRPVVNGDQLVFEAANTELFGFDLPEDVSSSITNAMADGMTQEVTGGLKVTDFDVAQGGIRVSMAGENVNFNELAELSPAYQP